MAAALANCLKINSPQFCTVLQQMNVSTPSIHVTCFDDDTYNKNMQRKLEDPTWAEQLNKNSRAQCEAVKNSLDHDKNKQENCLYFGDVNANGNEGTGEDKNRAHGEQNTTETESNDQTVKSDQPLTYEGAEVSSHNPSGKVTTTKIENNQVETKKGNSTTEGPADQLKTSASRTSRKGSWGSSDMQRIGLKKSASPPRRRYTVGSVSGENNKYSESQNNSNHNKRKAAHAQGPGSTHLNNRWTRGESKHSSEIMINKKKSERIDLSFRINPKSRSQTCGELAPVEKNSSGDRSSDEVFRRFDGDQRADNYVHSALVESPPTSPRVSRTSRKISENSLSILNNAGVTTNTDENNARRRSYHARRISTSMIEGKNSALSVAKQNSRPTSETDKEITQRLNLATPPQTRKFSSPKPPSGERHAQLSVRANRSLSKPDNDLRGRVSKEESVEAGRPINVSSPPHPRKVSSSLGVSLSHSLSKSETDLRKLVAEEEEMERIGSLAPQSPRMLSRGSTCQFHKSAPTFPLTPQQERNIYTAAAKQEARLPIRAKARNDLQATSQVIIDQAENEMKKFSEPLPHISMEQVMKTWQITDRRHWNMVSTVVNPYAEGKGAKTGMEEVKDCRYVRESVVTQKKKKISYKCGYKLV